LPATTIVWCDWTARRKNSTNLPCDFSSSSSRSKGSSSRLVSSYPSEQALGGEVLQPAHLHRRLADAHADLVGRRGAGLDDLHALARREGGAEQRVLFVGVLAGQCRDGGGQALAVPKRELGDLVALPLTPARSTKTSPGWFTHSSLTRLSSSMPRMGCRNSVTVASDRRTERRAPA
jgi:hypothetical protein